MTKPNPVIVTTVQPLILELMLLSSFLGIHWADTLVPHDGQNLASSGNETLQPGHLGFGSGATGMADGTTDGICLVSGSAGGTSMNSSSCRFSVVGASCS